MNVNAANACRRLVYALVLCVSTTGWAQVSPPADSARPAPRQEVRPATNPLLRAPAAPAALPIPPLSVGSGGGNSGGATAPGIAPRRVAPIPLNMKEVYARLEPILTPVTGDSLFGAAVFEILVDAMGRVTNARVMRYKHFEVTEKLRPAIDMIRCSPETLADVPQEGRTHVVLVYPVPRLDPTAVDTLLPEMEAVPVNLDQVRSTIGYPMRARAERLEGRVVVRVLVNEYGTYVRHRVLSTPHPVLTEAVEEWLYLLRCIPAFRDRRPVRSWLTVPIEFKAV